MKAFHCITTLAALLFLAHAAPAAEEPMRPLYHFTADKGWMNDPNGLVYDGSQYHMFFQHYASGLRSVGDELTWGHVTSTDLLHWLQLEEAVHPFKSPDGHSAGAWSGTAVMDPRNTSGFGSAGNPPMVLFWTATHTGQCIAYSTDKGKTFKVYDQNPIIPKPEAQQKDWDRDPDVFWYEPGKHWVLIYSISGKGYIVNTSTDLKHWTRHEEIIKGFYECPNCFELPVDGDANNRKWVLWDASSKYQIGTFDGEKFTWDAGGPFKLDHGKNYYAAQTWSDTADGRRIGIGWMNGGKFPGQVFNQQMGIPSEVKLKTIPGAGIRLVKYPVAEVATLRSDEKQLKNVTLKPGAENPLTDIKGEAIDIEADIERPNASTLSIETCGQTIAWKDDALSLGAASAKIPSLNTMNFRILIDRASIEVYADGGRVSVTNAYTPDGKPKDVKISTSGGDVTIKSMKAWKLAGTR
jgi:fructan beta-fructosidase